MANILRCGALVVTLITVGCTDRGAEPPGSDGGVTMADGGVAKADAAAPPTDAQYLGIACAATTCPAVAFSSCCWSAKPFCSAFDCEPGQQRNDCDGPEDCSSGKVCCLEASDNTWGPRCLDHCAAAPGAICHGDRDCSPSEQCVQLEVSGLLYACYPK